MSEKPLAYRLGLYISIAVLLVYMIIISWSYLSNRALKKQEAVSNALLINSQIIGPVREKIRNTQDIAYYAAYRYPFYQRYGETRTFLTMLLNNYEFLESIRIKVIMADNSPDTNIISISRAGDSVMYYEKAITGKSSYDETKIFSLLRDRQVSGWSEPYRCENNDNIVSFYYLPFEYNDDYNNARISGYVNCELSFNFLDKLIEKVQIGERGFAFLTSDRGLFITHPMKELVLSQTLFDLPEEVYKGDTEDLFRFLAGEQEPLIIYPRPLGYAKSWAYPTKIPENGWVLSLVIPFSELYRGLNDILYSMIAVSLFVVILVFFLVFYISTRIMYPLRKVSDEIHRFVNEKAESIPGTGSETRSLQTSLERLQKQWERYLQQEKEMNLRRARLTEDLILASEIQESIIPPAGNHRIPGMDLTLYTVFRPSRIVSGDLHDFFTVGDRKLLVTIGDVAGAGIAGAIFMGIAHTFIKSNASIGTAKEIVYQVNKELCKRNSNQVFITLFLGIIDTEQRVLNYCNAGHTPTFLLSSTGHVKELGDPHGLPLGLYHDRNYIDSTVHIKKNDTLILYTDGITERRNLTGEFFGVDAFYNLFSQFRDKSAEEMASIILKSTGEFASGIPPEDDVSLMIVKI